MRRTVWSACVVGAGITAVAFAPARGGGGKPRIVEIPASPQRLGDPEAGREFLLYGDYIGSGIPVDLYRALTALNRAASPMIEREGVNADIPHDLTRFTMPGGADVVAGANCLACHASMFRGALVVGMGNSLADWTRRAALPTPLIEGAGRAMYAEGSKERAALDQFLRGVKAAEGRMDAPFRGVIPAFRLEELAAAHRDPQTLSWSDAVVFEPLDRHVASDTPPWWHVKKKHALYYTGLGRGDFTNGLQQINVVAIADAGDAERHRESMDDLLAYLMTIEAPKHPGPVDTRLAMSGAEVFAANCAECHGTYDTFGEAEAYPNKLVPVEVVGTDALYAELLSQTGLFAWFNESWYAGAGGTRTTAEPAMAYVAPPLDGVWCSGPYFHNGSVPTVEGVLDPSKRPALWRRSFRDDDYDLDALGWRFVVVDPALHVPGDPDTYDTTIPGYGNGGHRYGEDLSDEARRALLEYLKTL